MYRLSPALLSAPIVLLTACAQNYGAPTTGAKAAPAAAQADQCFWLSQVSGFTDAGRDRIFVHTGPNDVYLFETFGPCPELNYSEQLAFEQTSPGTICRGLDVNLIVPTGIGPQRCPVRMISKLPEEEARKH